MPKDNKLAEMKRELHKLKQDATEETETWENIRDLCRKTLEELFNQK